MKLRTLPPLLTYLLTVRRPRNRSPSQGTYLRDTLGPPQGTPPRRAPHQTRTGRPCPPPTPQTTTTEEHGPFDEAELRAVYDIHAKPPSCKPVAALQEHLQDVNPNRLFAVVPLLHAASTNISVRHLQVLVIPGMQIADNLVGAWIWLFNTNQPDQGSVWVPHLGWAHTLIAAQTDPRPAPSTEGRERAAPQPRANALNIPSYNSLVGWESRTAPDRGRNPRDLVGQYPPGAETACAGPPRREDDPRTIWMIVMEGGHYYHVRITPHPQECHWNLEAVNSMLPARAALPVAPPPSRPKTNPQTP